MKRMLISAMMIVIAGCSKEPTKPVANKDADLASINKLRSDFIAAFNANDASKVGDVYSEEAVVMSEGQPTIHGRKAIVDSNKATFDMGAAKITLTPDQTEVFGDNGFDLGSFALIVTPKTGKPVTQDGRYLVLLQRETGGAWKVTTDMGNSSKPATPPPAPPAKAKAPPSKAKTKKK